MSWFFESGGQTIELQLQHQSFQWIFSVDFLWFDCLAVQATLKSLLQHHSLKASVLWCSAFFAVQLSLPYATSGKTTALTMWTFVSKVIPLLFSTLSWFVIDFLPRNKRLLISWLKSPSAVILEPWKIKSDTVSPSISYAVMGPDAMIFVFWMLSFKPTFSLSSLTFSLASWPALNFFIPKCPQVHQQSSVHVIFSCVHPSPFLLLYCTKDKTEPFLYPKPGM